MTNKQLKAYYKAIEDLTKFFCTKYFAEVYKYDKRDWVNNEIGGVIKINDYFFSISDIELAGKYNATEDELLGYHDFALTRRMKNKKIISFEHYLRYFRGISFRKIAAILNKKYLPKINLPRIKHGGL